MNQALKIGLIFLAIFLTIILFGIGVYFYYSIKRNRRLRILNKLKSEVKAEILVRADRVIIQIKKIFEKNPSYLSLLNKLTNLYDQIEVLINEVNKKIENLKIKYLSFSIGEFSSQVKQIKEQIFNFNKLSTEFSNLCHEFTYKDEFIRSEMVFLKTCLRDIIFQYRQNRVLLNEIASKIDEVLGELNDIEHDFDNALNGGEIKAASAFLDLYESKVYRLATIINEGPLITTHIFYNIPNRTKELINNFNLKKKEAPQQFQHINIDKAINKLVSVHRQSRTQYEFLKFDLAKNSIKQCHEILYKINYNINLEIVASNFFTQNYNDVVFEVGKALQRYITLRKKYRIILDHGFQGNLELVDKFDKLKDFSHQLDQAGLNLKKIRRDTETVFSAKLLKLKNVLNLLHKFVELENIVEKIIWLYNVESIIFKNKFQKIESAVNELIVNMREQSIIISAQNEINLQSICQQISLIGEAIYNDQVTTSVKEKIDALVEKVTQLYIAIGGDLQIAEIAKNMINELANRRLVDERLSYVLNMAEKDYMLGKYTEALNNIITFLGEKIYARI